MRLRFLDKSRTAKPLVCAIVAVAQQIAVATMAQEATPPIMGWSSWNTYHVNISDTLIMRQADAMVATGLKDAGYRYVNIDDGFFGHRDQTGKMVAHKKRFPQGMKTVADHIHSLGLKAGIYSDAGANTCGSRYDNDENGFGAGLYGHERQDAKLYFKDWGFDFIKIDYCGAGTELELDERKRYTEIHNAMEEEGCGDVSINICRWTFPGTWAAAIAKSWRISPDIRPRWQSVKNIIDMNMYLSAYCRGGHFNDMDMLEIGRGLKPNEEEVHFAMWCLMSSPLLIGCDLTKIPKKSLELLKNTELIAINQDTLCQQAYVAMRQDSGYVMVKDIEKRHSNTRAVALYNPSDNAINFKVPLSAIDLDGKVKLRDLLKRKEMKAVSDTITQKVPARSVMIMRAEGQRRTETHRYEAEWAYLPLFDNLGKRKKQIRYEQCASASGGMIVSRIGGEIDNTVCWDDVWSDEGGEYQLTIRYKPAPRRQMTVVVNGRATTLSALASEGEMSTVTINTVLNKGNNTVTIGNPYAWAPDIDCITLAKN